MWRDRLEWVWWATVLKGVCRNGFAPPSIAEDPVSYGFVESEIVESSPLRHRFYGDGPCSAELLGNGLEGYKDDRRAKVHFNFHQLRREGAGACRLNRRVAGA